jgi:hypothetical protein
MTPSSKSLRITVGLWLIPMIVEPVAAKGVTRCLVVTGPGLPAPINITDPAALGNVWGGEFLAAPTLEPDQAWPRYVVEFHVQPPRTDAVRKMYVIQYVRDPKSGAGFVYLPGRGDERYRLNVGTFERPAQDGKWHLAAATWSQAINARLP